MTPPDLKLDLGSGPNPPPGFVGLDWCGGGMAERVRNFEFSGVSPFPFRDETVSALRSHHFIEHLPLGNVHPLPLSQPKDLLFWFFDECYRVAKPGCVFDLVWPSPQSVAAFQDPTHRRFIPRETLAYLSRDRRRELRVDHYPVSCDWHLESVETIVDTEQVDRLLVALRHTHPSLPESKTPHPDAGHLVSRTSWNIELEHRAKLVKR